MTQNATVSRLARFSLTTANADRLSIFYEQAVGCRRIGVTEHREADFESLLGTRGGVRCITLALGDEVIELLEFENPGAHYPEHRSAADLHFQHFAIVVTDMTEAWFRLSRTPGWSPITNGLPQRLPESSGGVTAFKFRDSEGHPLELLSFPANKTPNAWPTAPGSQTSLGIDHSAISVANSAVSTSFYEGLGLRIAGHSWNSGAQQDALDGIACVKVEVTALSPRSKRPHVELLCYGATAADRGPVCKSNDIACTRLIFEGAADVAQRLSDPDGHHLIVLPDTQPRRPSL